ncbi:hypothetical protein [Burkholderia vietnamiensis]|uniref:hypothetical protein n=1 Tax=Burkholderia vietnamiensis TaxID=60552 RepID=UPI001CB2D71D|nr:hypothetical protein [Burkholderia vietnamiensis]CAG9197095.1 hypothetical protein BVI2075_230085 [Burkholderia vietnamiensis]
MAAIDVDDVAYVGVSDLVEFVRFLIDNKLDKGAIDHLAGLGVVDISVSQQAVTSVKEYIASTFDQKGEISPMAEKVIQCACCNAGCRNK